MSWTAILSVIGALIIASMLAYTLYIFMQLHKQRKALQQARLARNQRILQSLEIIANAMKTEECNHSEGVIRLKMLLTPIGQSLQVYPAMQALYDVVGEMPILEERQQLTKAQRRALDKTRESKEMELRETILRELEIFLADLEHF